MKDFVVVVGGVLLIFFFPFQHICIVIPSHIGFGIFFFWLLTFAYKKNVRDISSGCRPSNSDSG